MFHTAVLLVAQTGLGSNYTNWNITQCKTHAICALFCIPMHKPLQNLTGSQAAVRHWSVLDATGAKAKPNLPLCRFLMANNKQRRKEEETLSSPRRGQLALAAHHHLQTYTTAAAPRPPAGLQNDTMLLASSRVSFSISTEVVAGSSSFHSHAGELRHDGEHSVFLCLPQMRAPDAWLTSLQIKALHLKPYLS